VLLEQKQATTDVPYVSAFVPAVGAMQSAQQELCNVLDKPVTLHRLLGRIATAADQSGGPATQKEDDALGFRSGTGAFTDPTLAVPRLFGMRLQDSMGVALTSGPTSEYLPFWMLFPPGGNAWTMQRELKANEHVVATLSTPPTALMRPMISMVGYRTERI
jgi:hypothetical protein